VGEGMDAHIATRIMDCPMDNRSKI
jgi:hypothetical protein